MATIGRWLIFSGITIALAGAAFVVGGKVGPGRLPGDITMNRGSFTLFVPIATSIILSVGLTIILNLVARWRR